MSSSKRPWKSIGALATLALVVAPACGGPTNAGFRPGIDGGGTPGSAGSSGTTGNGGSKGATGGSGSGAGGVSGPSTDGGIVVDALPPFDGGTCTDNGGLNTDPNMTATTGTFSGPLAGAICKGGAYAHVESQAADDGGAPTITFFVHSAVAAAQAGSVRFQSPTNATSGRFDIEIGLPTASAGTYAQAQTCGDVILTAYLPAPDPSICATDADTFNCPDGCQLTGSLSQPCMPVPPEQDYFALGPSDCFGNETTTMGSWTLVLTSLTVDPSGPDSSGVLHYAPHGTLSGTLVDENPDGGAAGVSLSLMF